MDEKKLSKKAKSELEWMRKQVRENPDEEAEPSPLFDNLPQDERDFIIREYERIGGK